MTQLSDSAHTHTHTHTQYSGEASQGRLALREELRFRITRKKKGVRIFHSCSGTKQSHLGRNTQVKFMSEHIQNTARSVEEACCIDYVLGYPFHTLFLEQSEGIRIFKYK